MQVLDPEPAEDAQPPPAKKATVASEDIAKPGAALPAGEGLGSFPSMVQHEGLLRDASGPEACEAPLRRPCYKQACI